jgi:hypothetical protein
MKSINIKHTESGGCTLADPHATPGRDGHVTITEITDMSNYVAIADVIQLFDCTANIGCLLGKPRYSY